jgi:pyroglutamyl-peptidase
VEGESEMKILVTGFDPFGGEKINPAFEVIKRLRDNIEGAEVVKLEIPTAFYSSTNKIVEKLKEANPDVVLMIGQAGGRFEVTVERVGVNVDDARIPDNENQQPIDKAIDEEGLPAYFATIPIKAIVQEIKARNIPASVSNTAGTYVCNHIMYGVLNYIYKNKLNIKGGFIHIPYLLEQVITKPNTPAMSLEIMVEAIETAIEAIVKHDKDINITGGTVC